MPLVEVRLQQGHPGRDWDRDFFKYFPVRMRISLTIFLDFNCSLNGPRSLFSTFEEAQFRNLLI